MSDTYDDRHNVPGHPIKPAATVHDTGSGERCTSVFNGPTHYRCELPAGHENAHSSRCDNAQFVQVWPNVPTPPVSPTVTRAVELHLESICALAAEWDSNRMGSVAIHKKRWQKLAAIASDALALLRAAERQK